MTAPTPELPIRWTVCETAVEVDELLRQLHAAGFTKDEISVVCSQEVSETRFEQYREQHPAGSNVDAALDRSGWAALGLGAAAVVGSALTLGGVAVVIAGAFSGVAIAGTFASLMATRGAEKELADYYDQALSHDQILVAVTSGDPKRQRRADEVLRRSGGPTAALPSET